MALTKNEEKILYSIRVASENDPNKPEFPPEKPKFPASPTFKIKVPGFKEVWIKDESTNPTGTHKDRMAWEMIVTYRDILLAKKEGLFKDKLPQLSIISSGSAAVAIQTQLKKYGLPNLKVLVDLDMDLKIIDELESLGCSVYRTDLSRKPLHWKEILELTQNKEGIDVTSSEGLDPTTRFYDWLSYEIINFSPDYCFIPFGSGTLYENVLNINKRESLSLLHDPRFSGSLEKIRKCNFIGATVNDPKSKAVKLYAPHRPFTIFDEQWIRSYIATGGCGNESTVELVQEKFLDEAMKLAESQGIECEVSGIAGLGLLLQMKNKIPKNKKILIVNTGKTKHNY